LPPLSLHLAALTHPGVSPARDTLAGLPPDLAAPLTAPLLLTLTNANTPLLTLHFDPAAAALTARAAPRVLHYYRLADATLKPLLPAPPVIRLAPGDAYLALSPGVRALADSPAIARFLHLRDYFNAQRLAQATLHHLLADRAQPTPEDITIVVIEAR
jgi:hypothetical protein